MTESRTNDQEIRNILRDSLAAYEDTAPVRLESALTDLLVERAYTRIVASRYWFRRTTGDHPDYFLHFEQPPSHWEEDPRNRHLVFFALGVAVMEIPSLFGRLNRQARGPLAKAEDLQS